MKITDIKVKGLTKRWIFTVMGFVLALVVVLEIVAGFVIHSFYYDSVRSSINSRVNMSSGFLNTYASSSSMEFEIAAKEFVDNFVDKNIIELQIYDCDDIMIASSKGLVVNDYVYTDYILAKKSDAGSLFWTGKLPSREKIMSNTTFLPKQNGFSVGAIRYSVSLTDIDNQIMWSILMLLIIGVVVIGITLTLGIYFINSIIKPINAITASTLKIASGNFSTRLYVKEKDEIGKLCDSINYMASELASAEKVKNDFISLVSHELRTPLTVIKGWGETLLNPKVIDVSTYEKGMKIIVGETERLSGLVEDLLDFSRMQNGKLTLKMEKIDVLAELEETVYIYTENAKKDGIEISFTEPAHVPPILGDAKRLRQVFINIIDNAIKYSNKNSTVMVDVACHDIYLQVTVTDMGCGIAPDDLGRVKERFYKANTTVRGSGIGLAVADEIIKQHNGILEIDSQEGIGTTVTIVLPLYKKENQENNEKGDQNEKEE